MFNLSEAEIIERSRTSREAANDAISREKLGPFRWLHKLLYFTFFYGGPPDFKKLKSVASEAREIGFKPVTSARHGQLPLLLKTSEFVGPEGVTHLQAWSSGSLYLKTYFVTGSSICSSRKAGGNARTEYHLMGPDFAEAYREHLERVAARVAEGGQPLYMHDIESIRTSFRMFPVFHVSEASAAILVAMNAAMIGIAISIIAQILWVSPPPAP